MHTELFGLVELCSVNARMLMRFEAIKQSANTVKVRSSGASVLLPSYGAELHYKLLDWMIDSLTAHDVNILLTISSPGLRLSSVDLEIYYNEIRPSMTSYSKKIYRLFSQT